MKRCSDDEYECPVICDFCINYKFQTRWCMNRQTHKDPTDRCQEFHCYTLKEEENDDDID